MMFNFRFFRFQYFVIIIVLLSACRQGKENEHQKVLDSIALRAKVDATESPSLSPAEALKSFKIEDGFEVKLVASEPLIQAPVSMKFDRQGRIWVIEMPSYMPDTLGTGEDVRSGKIVILEDADGDGIMDTRKIFLDSLVLPRAICLFEDGILVAEPPRLWFVENKNDSAGKKYLVDEKYSVGGNVEHQPNGLLRGVDNWIYNAKSSARYRRTGKNTWKKEQTAFRGQWGISQDDFGRLYYNTNSDNLFGDFFTPGIATINPNQKDRSGFNANIVPDNRTYPIRPTPGVNRGYMKEVLDDSFRLVNFTAACSPFIFRSDVFGKDYYNNVFVAEPSANLVKRNILNFTGNKIQGKQAYEKREFLASTDERFRPVDFAEGPDGALYLVDMYRGIIQHSTYLTEYLKNQVKMRLLQQPLDCGRIYKIVPQNKKLIAQKLDPSPDALINYMKSPDAWLRETAKNYIVDQELIALAPSLRQILQDNENKAVRITALWALEGLNQLQKADLDKLAADPDFQMQQQAYTAAVSSLKNKEAAAFWLNNVSTRITDGKNDSLLAPYLAYAVAATMQYEPAKAQQVLLKIAGHYKNDRFVSAAIISGLQNREANFLNDFIKIEKDTVSVFAKQLKKVLENIENQKKAALAEKNMDKNREAGKKLFETICQACHGNDGNGIKSLAPPLNGSEWVKGDKKTLMRIVLYGLTGPIQVAGKLYTTPEIVNEMPGIGNNKQLKDEDIANILSYIRKAWNNNASPVSSEEVNKVRKEFPGREQPFTMEELKR